MKQREASTSGPRSRKRRYQETGRREGGRRGGIREVTQVWALKYDFLD